MPSSSPPSSSPPSLRNMKNGVSKEKTSQRGAAIGPRTPQLQQHQPQPFRTFNTVASGGDAGSSVNAGITPYTETLEDTSTTGVTGKDTQEKGVAGVHSVLERVGIALRRLPSFCPCGHPERVKNNAIVVPAVATVTGAASAVGHGSGWLGGAASGIFGAVAWRTFCRVEDINTQAHLYEKEMKEGFRRVHEEFDRWDERFDRWDDKFDRIEKKFDRLVVARARRRRRRRRRERKNAINSSSNHVGRSDTGT
mmetsp:Transcript_30511/g.66001  ORF Transcript_30511/g.66001 Transcript_30511/m.66001 type:complete len:252 (+) Transcript_30511:404-1159(+)